MQNISRSKSFGKFVLIVNFNNIHISSILFYKLSRIHYPWFRRWVFLEALSIQSQSHKIARNWHLWKKWNCLQSAHLSWICGFKIWITFVIVINQSTKLGFFFFEICSLGIVAFFLIIWFISKNKKMQTRKNPILFIFMKCREIMVVQKKLEISCLRLN